jgi:hypothetical protein
MRSLSIVIGARTALGRTLLAKLDPAEIVVCAARSSDEAVWLESHYPWHPVIRGDAAESALPFTRGPIRIYYCSTAPLLPSAAPGAQVLQSVLGELGLVRSVMNKCGTHRVHIAFASTASAALPSPHSICALTLERHLESLCAMRPDTLLSVFYPGRCIDRCAATSVSSLIYTSYARLACLMLKTAHSHAERRAVVGLDAHMLFIISLVRNIAPAARYMEPHPAFQAGISASPSRPVSPAKQAATSAY